MQTLKKIERICVDFEIRLKENKKNRLERKSAEKLSLRKIIPGKKIPRKMVPEKRYFRNFIPNKKVTVVFAFKYRRILLVDNGSVGEFWVSIEQNLE